jgi:hypothetical protein
LIRWTRARPRGDVFTDISGNGVQIGGVGKPVTDTDADVVRDVEVSDNHLYGLPREFHGGVPIVNGYTVRNTLSHNQIDHVGYSAVSVGWGGWPDKIQHPATPNLSHDNAVSDNLIFDYMLMLDDGGGIYTQGITGSSLDDGEKVTGDDRGLTAGGVRGRPGGKAALARSRAVPAGPPLRASPGCGPCGARPSSPR